MWPRADVIANDHAQPPIHRPPARPPTAPTDPFVTRMLHVSVCETQPIEEPEPEVVKAGDVLVEKPVTAQDEEEEEEEEEDFGFDDATATVTGADTLVAETEDVWDPDADNDDDAEPPTEAEKATEDVEPAAEGAPKKMNKASMEAELAKLKDDDEIDAHGEGPKQRYGEHEAEMAQEDLDNVDAALDAMIEAQFADNQEEIKLLPAEVNDPNAADAVDINAEIEKAEAEPEDEPNNDQLLRAEEKFAEKMLLLYEKYVASAMAEWQLDFPDEDPATSGNWAAERVCITEEFDEDVRAPAEQTHAEEMATLQASIVDTVKATPVEDARAPAWTRGEIEPPAGEKDMGGSIAGVYTEEQQARLGVDEGGDKVEAVAEVALDAAEAALGELQIDIDAIKTKLTSIIGRADIAEANAKKTPNQGMSRKEKKAAAKAKSAETAVIVAAAEIADKPAEWLARVGSLFGVVGEDDAVAVSKAATNAIASPDDGNFAVVEEMDAARAPMSKPETNAVIESFVSGESRAKQETLQRDIDALNGKFAEEQKARLASETYAKELSLSLATTKVSMRTFRDEAESKAALLASSLGEVTRCQITIDDIRQKAESEAQKNQVDREGWKSESGTLTTEVKRLQELFDGKELEVQGANRMVLELTGRAVTAEEKVEEITKVNDDLLKQLKETQALRTSDQQTAEAALTERAEQLVAQEKQLERVESKLGEAVDAALKAGREHDAFKVEQAGNIAALQARLDRHTAELTKERELRELDDTEKQEMRAATAATQAHAVQVQRAAIAFEERAKADLARMEQAAIARNTELDELKAAHTETTAQLGDARKQLESSDGRIRELLGGNPSDPRTEIIRLRMEICTFDAERRRFEAREMDYKAQLDGLSKALKFSTSQQVKIQEQMSNVVDKSGQVAVAENMSKLLEEEAATLRARISKEVSARAEAEQSLSTLQIDSKHLKIKMEGLEQRLVDAEARGSLAGGPSSSYASTYGSAGLGSAMGIGSSMAAPAGSTTYTGFGGIEYFNPAAYGSGGSGATGGSSYGSSGSSYGGMSGTGMLGMPGMSGSMSDLDLMRDVKLAEDRAKASEKRENILMEKLRKIETDSAMQGQNAMTGYVGIDVHTRLLDMADQRTRDAERKAREVETENLSLKNRSRAKKGLMYLADNDPAVQELLEKINNCIVGAKRIHHAAGGSVLADAEFKAQAAKEERAWRERMSAKEASRQDAEEKLKVAVEEEVVRQSKMPQVKKAAPPTSPKPTRARKGGDKKAEGPGRSPLKAVSAAAEVQPGDDGSSEEKKVAPKKLRASLTNLIAGGIPAQMGGSPLDVMKAAKKRAAERAGAGEYAEEDDSAAAAAAEEPTEGSDVEADPQDDLVGRVQHAPSLTANFSRPKVQRGKRLPSRKGRAQPPADGTESESMPSSVEVDNVVPPANEAAPPAEVDTAPAAIPPPARAQPDSDEDNNDDDDWSDDGQGAEEPSTAKSQLIQRMARLAGAGTHAAAPAPPVAVVLPKPPVASQQNDSEEDDDDWSDNDNEVEPASGSSKAALMARMAKLARAGSPARPASASFPPAPAPTAAPATPVKKAAPAPSPKPTKKAAQPAKKKAAPTSPKKPAAPIKKAAVPLAKKQAIPAAPKPVPVPVPEPPKEPAAPAKEVAATNLFAVQDDSDLLFGAKPKATAGKKKKVAATSLFDLDDDSDDDWMK